MSSPPPVPDLPLLILAADSFAVLRLSPLQKQHFRDRLRKDSKRDVFTAVFIGAAVDDDPAAFEIAQCLAEDVFGIGESEIEHLVLSEGSRGRPARPTQHRPVVPPTDLESIGSDDHASALAAVERTSLLILSGGDPLKGMHCLRSVPGLVSSIRRRACMAGGGNGGPNGANVANKVPLAVLGISAGAMQMMRTVVVLTEEDTSSPTPADTKAGASVEEPSFTTTAGLWVFDNLAERGPEDAPPDDGSPASSHHPFHSALMHEEKEGWPTALAMAGNGDGMVDPRDVLGLPFGSCCWTRAAVARDGEAGAARDGRDIALTTPSERAFRRKCGVLDFVNVRDVERSVTTKDSAVAGAVVLFDQTGRPIV